MISLDSDILSFNILYTYFKENFRGTIEIGIIGYNLKTNILQFDSIF